MKIHIRECTGRRGNAACRAAARRDKIIHVIPMSDPFTEAALVLPTYHYATADDAYNAVAAAMSSAPTVTCDVDLNRFRADDIAHFLPVGWVDPSRR